MSTNSNLTAASSPRIVSTN